MGSEKESGRRRSAFGWDKRRPAACEGGQRACPGACCARGDAVGAAGLEADGREAGAAPKTLGCVLRTHVPQLETEVSGVLVSEAPVVEVIGSEKAVE